MDYDDYMKKFKLFWQYPVITEKTFSDQCKDIEQYIHVPWATIIDKKIHENHGLKLIYSSLSPYIKTINNITCCQHISFRQLIPLFKALKINYLFTPHKIIGEDIIEGIYIISCPLYAVNIEDNNRNDLFRDKDLSFFLNFDRKYLYSFQGAYDKRWYLSEVREKIFTMEHPENTYIKHIGDWHFEKIVYNDKQNINGELNTSDNHNNETMEYNELLLNSRYTLCPSGSGPNSIRFWEALAIGSIPILLSDTLDLPENELWDKAIIKIKEKDLDNMINILNKISKEEECERRENCIKIYNHFKENYLNNNKNNKNISWRNTIFTSYSCDNTDNLVKNILTGWRLLNPSLNILYFSDNDINTFFKNTKYYDTYIKLNNGVAIADLFRICYINTKGGYWFDIDLQPIKLKLPSCGDTHLFDCGFNNISYMFIGGYNNKLFNDVITEVSTRIENNYINKKQHIMDITGPRIIQNLIFKKLNLENKDGVLKGKNTPEKYLENTNYEFLYMKQNICQHKTEIYNILQDKYNKKQYQYYNYI